MFVQKLMQTVAAIVTPNAKDAARRREAVAVVPVRRHEPRRSGARRRNQRAPLWIGGALCLGAAGTMTSSAHAVLGDLVTFDTIGTNPVVAGSGDQVTLELTVENLDIFGGMVEVEIPIGGVVTGVTEASATPSLGTYTDPTWMLTFPGGGGTETLTLVLDIASDAPIGMHDITADLTVGGVPETLVASFEVEREADLVVTKSANVTQAVPGDTANRLEYTVMVANQGPSDASAVSLMEILNIPPGTGTVSAISGPGTLPFGIGSTGGLGIWSGFSIASGATAQLLIEIDLAASVPSGGVISNVAMATSAGPGITLLNPIDDTSPLVSVPIVREVNILLTKVGAPDPFVVAGAGSPNIIYTVSVQNMGPSDADGVLVHDTYNLPIAGGVSIVDIDATSQVSLNGNGTTGPIAWVVDLPAGGPIESLTIDLTVDSSAQHGDVVENTATVINGADPALPSGPQDSADTTIVRGIDLEVTKVQTTPPGGAEVVAGSGPNNLAFLVTVTNNGPSDASNVMITDDLPVLPAGVTFVVGNASQGSYTDPTWNVGTLAANQSATLELILTVDSSAADGTTIDNQASVASVSETDVNGGNDASAIVTATVSREVDIAVTKTESVDPVVAGSGPGNLTYVITVRNDGPSDSAMVEILDDINLPNCVEISSIVASGGGVVTAGALVGPSAPTVNWTIAPMVVGQEETLTIVMNVLPCAAETIGPSTEIRDTVMLDSIGAGETIINPDNDDETVTTNVDRQVDLALLKTESEDPIVAGALPAPMDNQLTYVVTVTNNGPSDASGIEIIEDLTLPVGVSVGSVTPSGPQPSVFTPGGPPTTAPDGLWAIPLLPVNETVTLTVVLDVAPSAADGATIEDTATLLGLNELPDTDPSNNVVNEDTTVVRQVDLMVLKTDDVDPVLAGDGDGAVNLIYTLEVTNNGPSDASGIQVLDIPALPADVALVPPVTVSSGMMVGTDLWFLGNLAAAGTETMTRQLVVGPTAVPGSNVIENAAIISNLTEPDSNTGNNGTTEYTSIITDADVVIAKSHAPDPVVAGTEMEITLSVTNNGPSDAQSVVVTDVLPAEVTYISDTCGGSFDGTTFTLNIGTLADEATVECVITVMVNADVITDFDNTATVDWIDNPTPDQPDVPVNESSDSPPDPVVVETLALITITKVDDIDPIAADEILTYTIEVTNDGPSDAQAVTVMDALPAEVTLIATTGCTEDPNGVPTCTLGTIPVGTSTMYTVMVLVDPWASGTITNTATVMTPTPTDPASVLVATEDTQIIAIDRIDVGAKGSLLVWPKVELKWDAAGFLTQDTFLSLTNDYPGDVEVQLYFINGDAPLDADGLERAHPGWNWLDNRMMLTADQPTYWAASTGQPATTGGISPFTALDPGFPPGRPDPETGGRILRGYILGWAVDGNNVPIRWNHLAGVGTIVNYLEARAWEYNTYSFRVLNDDLPHGQPVTDLGIDPGTLPLNGLVYGRAFNHLFFNFQAAGSSAFSGPRTVVSDTDLTLLPLPADLRQETAGPVTTKARFEIWNENEIKFTGLDRCITCWDQTLISDYGFPNHFLIQNLQTDHGSARIKGLSSQVCNFDFDPGNNFQFPFPPGPGDPIDPRDRVSQAAPLLGVAARLLTIDGGADFAASGYTLVGSGSDDTATILFDGEDPFEEAEVPASEIGLPWSPTTDDLRRFIDSVIDRIQK